MRAIWRRTAADRAGDAGGYDRRGRLLPPAGDGPHRRQDPRAATSAERLRRLELAAKRGTDLVGAGLALVLASPLMAAASLAIKLESSGPVIYRQRRVGKDGEPFEILKLRTMVHGAERVGAGLAINEGDPRITRVGSLLRRFSLDEIPNLLNVVHGEMSIVGPRPTVQVQVDRYTQRQLRRLTVKPGITGWAQVNGRAALPWADRIELDIWYVDKWSLWLDIKIVIKTVRLLLSGHGLYKGESGGWKS